MTSLVSFSSVGQKYKDEIVRRRTEPIYILSWIPTQTNAWHLHDGWYNFGKAEKWMEQWNGLLDKALSYLHLEQVNKIWGLYFNKKSILGGQNIKLETTDPPHHTQNILAWDFQRGVFRKKAARPVLTKDITLQKHNSSHTNFGFWNDKSCQYFNIFFLPDGNKSNPPTVHHKLNTQSSLDANKLPVQLELQIRQCHHLWWYYRTANN